MEVCICIPTCFLHVYKKCEVIVDMIKRSYTVHEKEKIKILLRDLDEEEEPGL